MIIHIFLQIHFSGLQAIYHRWCHSSDVFVNKMKTITAHAAYWNCYNTLLLVLEIHDEFVVFAIIYDCCSRR